MSSRVFRRISRNDVNYWRGQRIRQHTYVLFFDGLAQAWHDRWYADGYRAKPGSEEWLASVVEDVVEPERPIIDTHHHLWKTPSLWGTYELGELWADTGSGHNIEKTIFIDCHSEYRTDGPSRLKPIGETEYVAEVAAESRKDSARATIAGIVGHANMTLGSEVEEVLVEHERAGNGLFRGIRHAGPSDDTGTLTNAGGRWPCPYGRDAEAQRPYYLHTIECFGPDRCMFESNFPVDRLSISYQVLWNGFKKIVANFSNEEKHAMFYGTAARIYRV